MNDPISPSHYTRFKITPLEYITANKLDFLEGNIIKYISRYKFKNGIEDLKKAKKYAEYLVEDRARRPRDVNRIITISAIQYGEANKLGLLEQRIVAYATCIIRDPMLLGHMQMCIDQLISREETKQCRNI